MRILEEQPADLQTTGAPDETEPAAARSVFLAGRAGCGQPGWRADRQDPHEVDEIMARAIRLRSVEANKIITNPADIQRYVETCWMEELPAAQAAHAALEAAGYSIVRDDR